MLSPADDYPIHQVPEPIRRPATSDRNFYDRYYFNCQPSDDEVFVILGMGQYPNLGTADAFALVAHEGHQRVVRASRALGVDRMDTTVGPLRVEVIEGLQRLRFVVEPNEFDIALDLTWEGAAPPVEEPRHTDRMATGRVFLDACRLAQLGRWSGTISCAGTEWEVTPDRWLGSRDRSWGIRPSGESEPPGITETLPFAGFRWVYAPTLFEDRAVVFICQERNDRTRVLEEAVTVFPDGSVTHHGRPEYELEWDAEERFVTRARLTAGSLVMDVEPMKHVYLGGGTGYGFDADWRHGMWQGELVVQGRDYDLTTPEALSQMFGIVDASSRAEIEGQVGYGLFEYMFI